jgi:uncharacterized RDD family membrane protein YckC
VPPPPAGWPAAQQKQPWQGPELASWGSRVASALIDGLAVSAITVGLIVIISVGFSASNALGVVLAVVLGLAAIGMFLLYRPVLMSREGEHNGQTWGKQAMGIRVIWDDGAPAAMGNSSVREIVVIQFGVGIAASFTAGIAYLVDYLWPLFDDENRALHDMLCKTHVVRA